MSAADSTIAIATLQTVNGMQFGSCVADLILRFGEPDDSEYNYTGELEMCYGDVFYRYYEDRLVEATFPDRFQFQINDVAVLAMFDWLGGLDKTIDVAKFRISLQHGIAYDHRDPENGSITFFEEGRWDQLIHDYIK